MQVRGEDILLLCLTTVVFTLQQNFKGYFEAKR